MCPAPSRVEWLQDELVKLNRRALPRDQFFAELAPRLRRVFDSDALCWHTLDPTTLLLTSAAPVELVGAGVYTLESVQAAGELMIAQEYMGDGINTFAQLARRRFPVGILSELTRGRPERSERYRELLAPAGIPFEMRAAFVSRRRAWGAVHVARHADKRDFTPADAAALARVAAAIADGIRTSLRFDAARRAAGAGAPGLVVLDAHDEVELITPPARELMAALRWRGSVGGEDVPAVGVLALAAHVRGAARAGAAQPGAVAVPSPIGWITLD